MIVFLIANWFNKLHDLFPCFRLCVATLKLLNFGSDDESVFGMFDGGYNSDVPGLLLDEIPKILQSEAKHKRTSDRYMKYTMLCAHMYVLSRQIKNILML